MLTRATLSGPAAVGFAGVRASIRGDDGRRPARPRPPLPCHRPGRCRLARPHRPVRGARTSRRGRSRRHASRPRAYTGARGRPAARRSARAGPRGRAGVAADRSARARWARRRRHGIPARRRDARRRGGDHRGVRRRGGGRGGSRPPDRESGGHRSGRPRSRARERERAARCGRADHPRGVPGRADADRLLRRLQPRSRVGVQRPVRLGARLRRRPPVPRRVDDRAGRLSRAIPHRALAGARSSRPRDRERHAARALLVPPASGRSCGSSTRCSATRSTRRSSSSRWTPSPASRTARTTTSPSASAACATPTSPPDRDRATRSRPARRPRTAPRSRSSGSPCSGRGSPTAPAEPRPRWDSGSRGAAPLR